MAWGLHECFASLFFSCGDCEPWAAVSISKFIAESTPKLHESMLKHALRWLRSARFFTAAAVIILPFIPVFDSYHPLIRGLVIGMIPTVALRRSREATSWAFSKWVKSQRRMPWKKSFSSSACFYFFNGIPLNWDTSLLISCCPCCKWSGRVCLLFSTVCFGQARRSKRAAVPPAEKRCFKAPAHCFDPDDGAARFSRCEQRSWTFLVKGTLLAAGVSRTSAIDQFGMLSGGGDDNRLFPAFIAHSLMVVMIPSISESYAYGQYERVIKRIKLAIFITLFYGIPSVMVMYHFADPLTHLFFDSVKASFYWKMLWPYFLFHFFAHAVSGLFNRMGLAKDAFIIMYGQCFVVFDDVCSRNHADIADDGDHLAMNTEWFLLTARIMWRFAKSWASRFFWQTNPDLRELKAADWPFHSFGFCGEANTKKEGEFICEESVLFIRSSCCFFSEPSYSAAASAKHASPAVMQMNTVEGQRVVISAEGKKTIVHFWTTGVRRAVKSFRDSNPTMKASNPSKSSWRESAECRKKRTEGETVLLKQTSCWHFDRFWQKGRNDESLQIHDDSNNIFL